MKRLLSLIITLILFSASLTTYLSYKSSVTKKAYFGDGYAIVRVFEEDGINKAEISTMRYAAEEGSTVDVGEKGRQWLDAYSYMDTLHVSPLSTISSKGNYEAKALVLGGDFFRFHAYEVLDGYYFTDTDLHRDRVVIDEKLSFKLYGSNNSEGMPLIIGNDIYYVAGVVRVPDTKAKEIEISDAPMIFLPEYIGEKIYGERPFTSYEVMMEESVDSYAITTLERASEGKTLVDVTSRYTLKSTINHLKNFTTRSYKTDKLVYPFFENHERGCEDTLAILFVVTLVTGLIFTVNLFIFITERKRR